jgi:hypothetical protein
MKPIVIIAIAVVLLFAPSSVSGAFLDESIFGFTIEEPKGWIREDLRNDGTDNIVRYVHDEGNAFLYVALDKTPDILTNLKGESYLREMESYFQNNCDCNNFTIQDSKVSSSNGKTAYFIVYHSKNSNSEPYVITKQIEIPDNEETWRITNQYGGNYYGNISINYILKSFKPITQNPEPNPLSYVKNSITGSTQSPTKVPEYDIKLWLFSLPIIAIILAVILKIKNSTVHSDTSSASKQSPLIRRGWTPDEKDQVRTKQDGKCNHCSKHPPRWEYHHVNGDRSDNSLDNCEGLCPNCHSVETHEGE